MAEKPETEREIDCLVECSKECVTVVFSFAWDLCCDEPSTVRGGGGAKPCWTLQVSNQMDGAALTIRGQGLPALLAPEQSKEID